MNYNCNLSYDLGVSEATLSRWRNGAIMSIEHAVQLANVLEVSLDWLLLGRLRYSQNDWVSDSQPDQTLSEYELLTDSDKGIAEGVNLIWTVISKITSISRSRRLSMLGS